MNIAELLKLAALFVMFSFLPGCYLPFGTLEVVKPDPLRKQAVKIIKVTGRTIALADGREIELAGLKPLSGGQDPHHAMDMQAEMSQWLIGRYVVVVPEEQGRGRVLQISMHEKTIYHSEVPILASPGVDYEPSDIMAAALFPIFVEKKSSRCDLGSDLLRSGLAEPLTEEISDPKIRAEYVANAESARKEKYGIWASADERLADAVNRGDLKTVRLLLDKGADPNWVEGGYGSNPLIRASWRDDGLGLEMVRAMLDKGGNPNLKGSGNETPLHAAAGSGNTHIVALLLKRGAKVDAVTKTFEETPLHFAATTDNVQVAAMLLKHGADVNAVGKTYIDGQKTPVMAAAESYQQEMVGFLLGKGADLKVAGGSEMVLHNFCSPGESEIFKLLVKHGANLKSVSRGKTLLNEAAYMGALKTVEFLISYGLDVNAKDRSENTPLHEAVLGGKKEVVELLIAKGADVNIRGNGRWRPLKIARHRKYDEIAKILLAHGARE